MTLAQGGYAGPTLQNADLLLFCALNLSQNSEHFGRLNHIFRAFTKTFNQLRRRHIFLKDFEAHISVPSTKGTVMNIVRGRASRLRCPRQGLRGCQPLSAPVVIGNFGNFFEDDVSLHRYPNCLLMSLCYNMTCNTSETLRTETLSGKLVFKCSRSQSSLVFTEARVYSPCSGSLL